MAGGSFSNWWCSVFNVDLALSVALTTISTACSVFMLPLNLFVYARLAFGHSVQVRFLPLAHPWLCSSTTLHIRSCWARFPPPPPLPSER